MSAISGGISAELANILENPEDIIDLLANSLPAQSSYFIQILLVSTFLLQSLELLRIYPLGCVVFRRCMGPRVTKKERRKAWGWIYSLEDPPEFWHAETFAQIILYYVVFFVYAVIAPVTAPFIFFCFTVIEMGYRYQFFHNYPKAYDTGGRLWFYFLQFTLASMIIAQLTLIGLLVLKQSHYAGPGIFPLIAMTAWFILFLHGKHFRVIQSLPTRDCVVRDRERSKDADQSILINKYLQPALQSFNREPEFDDDPALEIDERLDLLETGRRKVTNESTP